METVTVSIREGSEPRSILIRTRPHGSLAEWVGPVSLLAQSLSQSFDGWRVDRVLLERVSGKGVRPRVEILLRQADRNTDTPSEAEIVSICERHGL